MSKFFSGLYVTYVVVILLVVTLFCGIAGIVHNSETPDITLIDGVEYHVYKHLRYCTVANCDPNIVDLEIPQKVGKFRVSEIDRYAFWNCTKLERVVIPEGITEIPDYTFQNCYKLKVVYLSRNIQTIGYNAFDGCYSLEEIHYAGSENDFREIDGLSSVLGEDLWVKIRFNSTP